MSIRKESDQRHAASRCGRWWSDARRVGTVLVATLLLAACAVNPVTGEREFQIYGAEWEQQVGGQMYQPLKQSQGGDFILDPELTAYVQAVGERLARQAARADQLDFEFSVLNNSSPNAWALPGGKIVVNRGLLTALDSEAELAAVMAHEIVHADAAHGAQQQSTGMLAQVGAVASMVVLGSTIENQTARQLALLVPTVGMQLIMQRYGRDAEREADEYGMRYMSAAGYDPQGAVRLQETFVELSRDREQDWLSGLFASHPPSQERVENNRETAAQLPPGGEVGREEYQRKVGYLEKLEPAYTAYDEAGQALAEEDLGRARRKLGEALAIEPREALFISMQGDIEALGDEPRDAVETFGLAIRANERLFYPWLRRGQLRYRLDDAQAARADLERSVELLPTAEAHYVLGRIDQDAGRTDAAIAHFRTAAGSQSDAGQKAQAELVRLDLAQNPSRYVATRAALDAEGNVWVELGNRTGVPLTDIELSYAWIDASGQPRRSVAHYGGTLPGGQTDRLRLNLRLADAAALQQRFQLEITAARPAD
ncbi:MAG: M48 family metalloprotease [Xanthomonadales bacterium]|nr:M48 family metalloprotease [Xanthomonadales bacterium]